MKQPNLRRAATVGALALVAIVSVAAAPPGAARHRARPVLPARVGADSASPPEVKAGVAATGVLDSLYGRSGKLLARFISASRRVLQIPALARLFGDSAAMRPAAVVSVEDSTLAQPFSFISLLPFSAKVKGRIGSYRIGFWPAEHGRLRSDAYENPAGFIEVTPENENLRVSEHFRLRDFLTHDQQAVWPKYLVLREALVDKLELVIADLEAHGTPVEHMAVMSGFRTPQYNAQGVGRKGGRARDSRHQFGDAADVFVDNDDDGRLDDLNHDGRVDYRDVRVMIAAVERVEARYPDLVGGAGVYKATRAHGPFAHIDVRGKRARWGRI